MAQQGTVSKRDGRWYLSYRDSVLVNGQLVRKQKMEKLADVGDRYRCESDLADLVREKLDAAQAVVKAPKSASEFNQYFEDTYLPAIRCTKAPSTVACYKEYFRLYIQPHLEGYALRDVNIRKVAQLLESAASLHKLNTDTTKKIRSILSAVFSFAISNGDFPARSEQDNPARRAYIGASAAKPKPTRCPTSAEFAAILAHLAALPLEKAAVALIGECGLRPGEARAVRWEEYDRKEMTLRVSKSLWHKIEKPTKTERSNGLVPVTPLLAEILAALRKLQSNPISGRILKRVDGSPMNLDNASKRTVCPALQICATCGKSKLAAHEGHDFKRDAKTSVDWCGFYSLRRLHGTRVQEVSDDDTAAASLRNTKTVARKHYLKPVAVLPSVRRAVLAASAAHA
jgi:integrase